MGRLRSLREDFWFIVFLVVVALWRKLSKVSRVQAAMHKVFGVATVVLQWYTLFFFGIVSFAALAIVSFFSENVIVPKEEVTSNLRQIYEASDLSKSDETSFEDFQADLSIPMWLVVINVLGQLAGLAVVGIVMYHCWALLVLPTRQAARSHSTWEKYQWHVPKRINWLLWIIVLPAVFTVEMMFSNVNVWGIMIGTAPEYDMTKKYQPASRLELLYVHEDLQVATMIQFTAIYAFTRLISSLFENTELIKGHSDEMMQRLAKEYKRLLRLGGFLGVWLYIIAGMIRAVFIIGITIILQFYLTSNPDITSDMVVRLEGLEKAFVGMIGVTFTILTLLSVLNMIIMTSTFIVSEKLGDKSQGHHDANKKFLGARVLLVCSEVVPKIIDVFEQGTPMFEQTHEVTSSICGSECFLYLSMEQAEVLKITILSLACLVAVVMNYVFWKDLDIVESGLLEFQTEKQQREDDGESLLDAS
jgi:hypothetical protein